MKPRNRPQKQAARLRWGAGLIAACLTLFACSDPEPSGPPDDGPVRVDPPAGWDSDIAPPTAEDLDPSPGIVEVALEARLATREILPGVRTEVWTYNGGIPGPTLRARRGDRLVVRFTNHLPEPTTVHWHGLRVAAEMDGTDAAQQPVRPGETFVYTLDLLDAGTYWYHPHVHSSWQVGYGLYGAVVVEDPEEPFLGDDLVLVLSDIGIEEDGTLTPGNDSGWFGDYFGREGNVLLANGKVLPTLRGRAGVAQRWRIVNAARSRYQRLSVPGQQMVRLGGDGGLAEKALPVDEIVLAPGERAEVLIIPRPQPDGAVRVQWRDWDRFHIGTLRDPVDLFTFALTEDAPVDATVRVPERLRTIEPVSLSNPPVQRLELMEKSVDGTGVLGINGLTASEAPPLMAHAGVNEVWELTNSTAYDHPFHLHGFFFQVLDIDGVAPAVREWRDTVNVRPGTRVRMAIQFDNRPGMWMFHCHILDHADLGMMGMLHVMP
ncbi:multicopper oxidase family protein [Myxococcus sp. RHSTA-1-4]|uniref:multicopper oxidase family protein n=1 Tax=Myxococcus sp. RHSTA-1-4 TaxID=2874601 RepID=UPI001CBE5AAE|nr:multicopper oxidase family protein [Myxococcus sp. RHSTA-1-4]MBZ4420657.1 multicopper oxidase family protein [Myxococcus sp. RHSTA-1-4]